MRLFNLQVGSIADGGKLDPAQAAKRWLAYGSFLGIAAFAAALAPLVGIVQLVWTLACSRRPSPARRSRASTTGSRAARSSARRARVTASRSPACIFALVIPIIALFSIVALIFLGGQVSSILSAVGDSV